MTMTDENPEKLWAFQATSRHSHVGTWFVTHVSREKADRMFALEASSVSRSPVAEYVHAAAAAEREEGLRRSLKRGRGLFYEAMALVREEAAEKLALRAENESLTARLREVVKLVELYDGADELPRWVREAADTKPSEEPAGKPVGMGEWAGSPEAAASVVDPAAPSPPEWVFGFQTKNCSLPPFLTACDDRAEADERHADARSMGHLRVSPLFGYLRHDLVAERVADAVERFAGVAEDRTRELALARREGAEAAFRAVKAAVTNEQLATKSPSGFPSGYQNALFVVLDMIGNEAARFEREEGAS